MTAESLIAELELLKGRFCPGCAKIVGPGDVLMSIVMGFGNGPQCFDCLAKSLAVAPERFRESLLDFIRSKACYLAAWNWACEQTGLPQEQMRFATSDSIAESATEEYATDFWDAKEMGCGELVLELRLRLTEMRAGEVLKLCARDPGAPEDLPAWCRLTGHKLMRAVHPLYWIKRRE